MIDFTDMRQDIHRNYPALKEAIAPLETLVNTRLLSMEQALQLAMAMAIRAVILRLESDKEFLQTPVAPFSKLTYGEGLRNQGEGLRNQA